MALGVRRSGDGCSRCSYWGAATISSSAPQPITEKAPSQSPLNALVIAGVAAMFCRLVPELSTRVVESGVDAGLEKVLPASCCRSGLHLASPFVLAGVCDLTECRGTRLSLLESWCSVAPLSDWPHGSECHDSHHRNGYCVLWRLDMAGLFEL